MKVGLAQTLITPGLGVDLAGFGRPGRKATGVHDDLYLSSMVIDDTASQALIICADLLGFGPELAGSLKKDIRDRFGFPEDRILLCASHTHSGPQVHENMLCVGEKDEKYIASIKSQALASVGIAFQNMFEADAYFGLARCRLGINRRRPSGEGVEFAPYEDGAVDEDVTVLKIAGGGSVKAVLYSYTCHPSIIDSDLVSADYPGRARRVIKDALGENVPVLFVQGCCGDIRARTVEGCEFRAGTWDDVDEYGLKLGNVVASVCGSAMQRIDVRLSSKIQDIMLPLQTLPGRDELAGILESGAGPQKVWAERMLSGYDSLRPKLPFTVQRVSLGEKFHIIALSGEICVEYAKYIKQKDGGKTFITAGYANGVIAYIPTAPMLEQGGYEPDGSTLYYGMPTRFDNSVERIVKSSIDDVLK